MTITRAQGLIEQAVLSVLDGGRVRRIDSQSTADATGLDAFRVTVVLESPRGSSGDPDALTGDEALDVLVNVRRSLSDAGEDRFPYIEYITQEEIEQHGGGEP